MALKTRDRYQTTFLPEYFDDHVSQEGPVRTYDVMIDNIGPEALELEKRWKNGIQAHKGKYLDQPDTR